MRRRITSDGFGYLQQQSPLMLFFGKYYSLALAWMLNQKESNCQDTNDENYHRDRYVRDSTASNKQELFRIILDGRTFRNYQRDSLKQFHGTESSSL